MAESKLPIVILLLFSGLAAYCIVGLQLHNGYFDLLNTATSAQPRKLPGSSDLMIKKITGFEVVDDYLGGLLMFFWPIVTGESPSLSLFAFYATGQILPMQTLLLVEGLHSGNVGKFVSYTTIWGVLYQSVPWGIVMPLYFAIYLWTSPIALQRTSKSHEKFVNSLSIDTIDLVALPLALIIGFVIPTTLAARPPLFLATLVQQQCLLVFWQGFPVWIAISQWFLRTMVSIVKQRPKVGKSSRVEMAKLLSVLYTASISLTALIHIITIIFAIFPYSRPAHFAWPSEPLVDLKTVFLPMSPFSNAKVERLTHGCLNLLQYDVYFACGAAVFWAAIVFSRLNLGPTFLGSLVKSFFLSLLVGPGGAALVLIWQRDETVLQVEKWGEKRSGKST